MSKPMLIERFRRLWALSASGEAPVVIERTERVVERIQVPGSTAEDIYLTAISRLELLPGDILVAQMPDGPGGDVQSRAARVLNRLAEERGATLLLSDTTAALSVLSFKRAERRLERKVGAARRRTAATDS